MDVVVVVGNQGLLVPGVEVGTPAERVLLLEVGVDLPDVGLPCSAYSGCLACLGCSVTSAGSVVLQGG